MPQTHSSHPTLSTNINNTLRPNATPSPSLSLARSLTQVSSSQVTNMGPLQLFFSQVQTPSAETRVDAMRRLFVVANAIGTEETLSKLVPFLDSLLRQKKDMVQETTHKAAVPTGTEEEDEILLILAEQIGQLVFCGLVPPQESWVLFPLLEHLAGVEETVVRDKAVESLRGIIMLWIGWFLKREKGMNMNNNATATMFVKNGPGLLWNMVRKMVHADWFTAKVSVCALLPAVYQFFQQSGISNVMIVRGSSDGGQVVGDESSHNHQSVQSGGTAATGGEDTVSVDHVKMDLRSLYKLLSEDETPMVRRAAGKYLANYAETVANLAPPPLSKDGNHNVKKYYSEEPIAKQMVLPGGKDEQSVKKKVTSSLKTIVYEAVVPIYQALCHDELDNIRMLAISASGSIGCALGLDGNLCSQVVLPMIQAGVVDISWRVRKSLASNFAIVAQSQGFHESSRKNDLLIVFESFSSLLQDCESQVRSCAVTNIARMAQLGGVDLFQAHVVPLLPALADDEKEVRIQLALTIMDCCNNTVCTVLTDKMILRDLKPCLECLLDDEFAEVQLPILSKLSRVTHLLDQMDLVVQSVVAMSKNPNWRVREAVGYLLPHLAEARGVGFFKEQLLDVWMALFLDQVANVRSSCVNGMSKLLSVTGSSWIQREIIPRYMNIYNSSVSYLTRITVLKSFSRLANCEDDGRLSPDLANEVTLLLLKGLDDKVVNVRMVAAKGLEDMKLALDDGILNSKILPALEQIVTDDPDEDCKFYAQNAINNLSG